MVRQEKSILMPGLIKPTALSTIKLKKTSKKLQRAPKMLQSAQKCPRELKNAPESSKKLQKAPKKYGGNKKVPVKKNFNTWADQIKCPELKKHIIFVFGRRFGVELAHQPPRPYNINTIETVW